MELPARFHAITTPPGAIRRGTLSGAVSRPRHQTKKSLHDSHAGNPGEFEVVSDVTVTDGVQTARAISFFTVAGGKIRRLVEFWPEPYEAPAHRAHLVERMNGSD
jgi:hypothetical protein